MKLISFTDPSEFIHGDLFYDHHEFTISFDWSSLGEVDILYPLASKKPCNKEGLWNETCFEFFIKKDEHYLELNFSPSGCWNVYSFTSYRASPEIIHIHPNISFMKSQLKLNATFSFPRTVFKLDKQIKTQLSAIIFSRGKEPKFFALSHPKEKPDFHHPDHFKTYRITNS